MLFLGKVRTIASENEQTFNGKSYSRTGLGGSDSYAIKSFSGIEKTFKAHSPETGSKVKVAFKTGFTGDLNGTKAKYLVEVVYRQNDSEVTAYTYTFEPQPRATVKNDKGIVTPAKDGTGRAYVRSEFNNYTLNKAEVEAKMAEDAYKPNGQAGTFTSSDIDLPAGVTEYTVRIKVTDTERMGMGYQSPLRHYALPVTGLDFSVEQDTRKLAKNLLQRVYDKLKATEAQDIKGKTDETISAYKEQLKNVENLLAGELNPTQTYKDIVTAVLAGQQALRTDKSKLDTSNTKLLDLINETPDPRIGKTPNSITPYDSAKEEAKKAQADAQSILNQENPDPDVVAAAVSKLNEKLAELKAARAELVVAATEDQKTKLKNDSDALKPADTNGKTPKSIEAYNARYKQLEEALNKAKEEAKKVLDKEVNAGKVEATDAQIEVDKIKAELDKAAALLKDKGNTDELENAKNELKTAAEVPNVTDGKTKGTSDKYDAAKTAAEQAVTAAEAVISDINSTTEDVANALAKVNEKKAALEAAKAALVDKITQDQKDDLTNAEENLKLADTKGKTKDSIKAYNDEVAKLSDELEAAKQAAKDLVDKGDNAGELEAYRVQAKINKLKSKLAEAAKLLKDIDKSVAKKEVEDASKKATDVIVANNDLTSEQKAAAKAKVAEEATKAIDAIDKAKSEDDIKAATDAGKLAIEKEAAKAEIEAAKAAKEKAIEANDKLSDAEKQAAKEEAAKAADEAKKAIDAATDNAGVAGAKTTGTAAVEAVNPVGKDKAKAEIEKELAEKTKVIDTNADLTPDQKAEAKAKIAEEAKKAIDAIDKATTTEEVASAKESGKLAIEKEAAKAEIEAAKAAKEKAIDARTDLTDEEKATAKARVEEEAEAAKNAIDKATDLSDLDKVTETGKDDIKRVTVTSAKEEAKKAIDEALAAKEKAIDARTDLTDEEKAAAKKAAREEAEAAKKAIDKATTLEDINKVLEDEKANIAKINPAGAKEEAKKAIDEALVAKEKAIDARTDLTDEEKAVAKKAAREEAEAAKNAIDKATTSEDINKVLEDGKANIAKINPVGTKEDSKKSIEERLTDKENRQPNNTPVKPQEDAKPAEVPSDNSEQPAVNQTEDVKGNSSTTSQETKGSKQTVLPNTGTGNEISIFGSAAMTVLASLGLVATSKKKEEE